MSGHVYLVWKFRGGQDVTGYELLGVFATDESARAIAEFHKSTYVDEVEVQES